MLPAQPNQSLIDGLACLQTLASSQRAVGVRELARQLDLEPTRANRLVKTLAHLGLAEQNADRKYRVGPAIHVLAAQAMFGSGLLRKALPHLESLRTFGCVVALGVLWRDRVCYLYHASVDTPPGEALGRVGLYPVARSGIGCALLAAESDAQVRDRLADCDSDEVAKLLPRLAKYRRAGLAKVDQHVRAPGEMVGYGIAIGKAPTAAIGVSGNFDPDTERTVTAALRDAAIAIESDEPMEAMA